MDERLTRRWASAEAHALGDGGIAIVGRATGLSRTTIRAGRDTLGDPVTRGDPESPLRWTSKSTRRLVDELGTQGYPISPQKVGQLLHASG
jgi:hypothetical protein